MKLNPKKIAKRLTGISTPIGGISWQPPKEDREIVRKLIIFLEDRRALYNTYTIETPHWVIESVIEIRKRLTETIENLDENSGITPHLRAMRAACRKFLDQVDIQNNLRKRPDIYELFTALGEMRAIFGIHIAQLCLKYEIEIEGELSLILPVEDTDKKNKLKKKDIE